MSTLADPGIATPQLQTPLPPARDHQPTHAGVEKLHALTGLRFAAAAMIVVHHARSVFGFLNAPVGDLPLNTGVSFFFVLSGFILAHVYSSLDEPGAVRRFFSARIARVWPAHLFTFLVVVLLHLGHGMRETTAVGFANATMLHAIVPMAGYYFSFNSVSWSISTEFFFYLAFPFLISRFAKSWWWKMLLSFATVSALLFICARFGVAKAANAAPFQIDRAGLLYISPLARIAEFILGMTAAQIWKSRLKTWKGSLWAGTALEIGVVAICIAGIVGLSSRTALSHIFGENAAAYLRFAGAAPAFAMLIAVFACQRGCLSRFFGTRGLVLLGEISFSVYLLHTIFLERSSKWLSHLVHSGWSEGWLFAGFWMVLIASAWLVWRGVERPARSLLLRLAHIPWASASTRR